MKRKMLLILLAVVALMFAGEWLKMLNYREEQLSWSKYIGFVSGAVETFHHEKGRFPADWPELMQYGAQIWPQNFEDGRISGWLKENRLRMFLDDGKLVIVADVEGYVTETTFAKNGAELSLDRRKSIAHAK